MSFNPSQALKHRVIMLAGDEEALRRRALDAIFAAAEIQKDDFDLETWVADESAPMQWFASVGTAPFMSDRRTGIVRHLLRCEPDKLKGTDFSNLPESSLLILVADDEAGDDNKQSRLKTLRKAWEKAVTSAGGACYVFDPDPKAVRDAIKGELIASGKTMTEPAVAALMEMTEGSLSRALDELNKLALFIGEQGQIRESDVREVVVPSREWNVFKMVDSVFLGQMHEALRQLRVLVGSPTKAEDAAFSRILPMISRHLRQLWQARICVEARCQASNAPASVAQLFPEKHGIAKENSYRLSSLMSMANRLSFLQIEKCFAIVADTDARLKGSLASFSALDTLERMLLDMGAVVSK